MAYPGGLLIRKDIRRPRLGACSGGAVAGILKVPSNGRRCASFLPGWSVAAMVFAAALSLSPWPCLGGSRACCEAVAAGLWLVCTALLALASLRCAS